MTDAHRRKKQPDVVRSELLRSAAEIAAAEGMSAVTLDAVAARAGVTRGGLQYHFNSKQALLEALFCEMRDGFAREMEAEIAAHPVARGSRTRAYIRVAAKEPSEDGETNALRALVAILLTQPELRERWAAWWSQTNFGDFGDEDDLELVICRLAADGLWLANLLDLQELAPAVRLKILGRLEEITERAIST